MERKTESGIKGKEMGKKYRLVESVREENARTDKNNDERRQAEKKEEKESWE